MNRLFSLLAVGLLLVLPASAQQFGGSMLLVGDDAIVSETGNRAFPGEVYVFNPTEEGWQASSVLSSPTPSKKADMFGSSMAHSGGNLFIGAAGAMDGAGSVYVYNKGADGWRSTATIEAPGGEEAESFGRSVAAFGDKLFVADNGAVHVYSKVDGAWTMTDHLMATDLGENSGFGSKVLAGDGMVVVSAPTANDNEGAVFVFRERNGTWSQQGPLPTGTVGENARLGSSLFATGNFLLAGAPRAHAGAGTVVVYQYNESGDTGNWSVTAQINPVIGSRFGLFGSSIEMSGNEIWIGAPGAARRQGRIYRYMIDTNTGEFISGSSFAVKDLPGRAQFGSRIIATGGDRMLVGSTGYDMGEGAAMVLKNEDGNWMKDAVLINGYKGFDSVTDGTVRCSEDDAAGFPCKDMDMLSFVSMKDIGGDRGIRTNDIWGWEDPVTGHEYALVGRTDATVFLDVTNPNLPVYVGELMLHEGANISVWRDIKVYKDHAFIVADGAGPHGVQVFDLTQLRDVQNAPVTFEETAHYDGIASAHNIVINEDTGFAFVVGSSGGGETCGGGLHMLNIDDPVNPTFAGCFADSNTGRRGTGYSHDAQCVTYAGPDSEHSGKEICFGSNETAVSIADVSDKQNPVALSSAAYPNVAYTHQGWLTEDHRYFYLNDEGDEARGLVEGTRTLIWDVSDLDDPVLAGEYLATDKSIDHNLYVRGNLMYQSNYVSGLRVLDVSNPEAPVEVGFFDTVPYGDNSPGTGGGSWSNYPYFKSGIVVVTSSREGVFVLKKSSVGT